MAQPVVDDDAHRIGQVQAPDVRAKQRDLIEPVGMAFQQVVRQPHGFFAKHQEHVVLVIDVVMRLGALARQEGKVGVAMQFHEGTEALVGADVQVLPVVQPGPFEPGIGDLEPKGLDEVQGRPRGQTQPANVPRIGGNLRLYKYDIESHQTASVRVHLTPSR